VPRRNPPWSRDELILALDLYFGLGASRVARLSPSSREIVALSKYLRSLPLHIDRGNRRTFRNPNAVCMKLFNFMRFDGKPGLPKGGQAERELWREFAGDPDRLHETAQAIRVNATAQGREGEIDVDDEDSEAPEGSILWRAHRYRERSRKLVRRKKELAEKRDPDLKCEVCGFSFRQRYRPFGEGFVECHHTIPLSKLTPGKRTRLEDLILVCSNCHRTWIMRE
jgi:5-methylcytosine-specific restriction protein A